MRAQFILLALIVAGDDGKLPTGRQGREGRDFLSPIQPNGRNNHIHERRPRTYACEGKNNADIFSRPSRPTRSSRHNRRPAFRPFWGVGHPPPALSSARSGRPSHVAGGGNRREGNMSNRPARISQAEIERAIRAARKTGATEVEVKMGDGVSIRIPLAPDRPVAEGEEIVTLCPALARLTYTVRSRDMAKVSGTSASPKADARELGRHLARPSSMPSITPP
jgi:hypothetical protein